jgi:hypothetical protein
MEANVIVGICVGVSLITSAIVAKVMDNRERKRDEFIERMKKYNKPKFGRTTVKPFKRETLRRA